MATEYLAFDYHRAPESTELAEEIFNTPKEEGQIEPHDLTSILLEKVEEGKFRLTGASILATADYKALYDNEYAWLLDSLERELQANPLAAVLGIFPAPSSFIKF